MPFSSSSLSLPSKGIRSPQFIAAKYYSSSIFYLCCSVQMHKIPLFLALAYTYNPLFFAQCQEGNALNTMSPINDQDFFFLKQSYFFLRDFRFRRVFGPTSPTSTMTSSVSTPALYQKQSQHQGDESAAIAEPSPRRLKKSFSRFSFLLPTNDYDENGDEDQKKHSSED